MGFKGIRKLINDIKQWTWHHVVAFSLTFFLYATFHVSRKAFSNIKNRMAMSITPVNSSMYPYNLWQKEAMFDTIDTANVFLGNLDLSFFLAYALGLYVSGFICDRVNLRYMLTFGLWGSALTTLLFGYVSAKLEIFNQYYYLAIFFLNGLMQSTGRPATVAIMGNWFTRSSSGLVFGVWSCNGSIGNVIGSLMVASVIEYGYEYGMLLVSAFSFFAGIICFLCIVPHPNDIGIVNPDQQQASTPQPPVKSNVKGIQNGGADIDTVSFTMEKGLSTVHLTSVKATTTKPITFVEACFISGVIPYSLANACLKMVNYSFLFWLPTFLSQGLHIDDKRSDNLSNLYDVGGMIGGITAGVLSDFLGYRSPVLITMMSLSLASIYWYQAAQTCLASNIILMILTGFLLGGPANTISSTISADLGKHPKIKGSSAALGTVTGIVEGTGSVGAAIGQRYVAVIKRKLGWSWVFYILIIITAVSVLLLLPILVKEIRKYIRKRKRKRAEKNTQNVSVS